MSVNQSDLTRYGFDMVTAVTQASVNVTMKQFLEKYDGQEFIMCYVGQKNSDTKQWEYVPTDYKKLVEELGTDPFSIPDGTSSDNPYIQRLYTEFKFAFGFKASMGLPDFPPSSIPDIVVLDQGISTVTYNLVCKTFDILNLASDFGDLTWSNISQSQFEKPWVFKFNISLDLSDNASAFAHLPEDVQKTVKNLCPGSMFSVEQLYLDLNTAGLASSPTIVGLDPSSAAYMFLTRYFLNTYFKNLQEKQKSDVDPQGNFLLGYTIKPIGPVKNASLIPTDLNFAVSPCYDKNGVKTTNYNLYTLNYLSMANNNIMPPPVPFTWNWVDESTQNKFHGVIAIKKANFVEYLRQTLSPNLQRICLLPIATIDVGFISVSWYIGYKRTTDPQWYNVVNEGNKVLTFSFQKEARDKGVFVPNWGDIEIKTSAVSDVYLERDRIKIVTEVNAFVHINIDGGVTEGNFARYRTEVPYLIGVDAFGQLFVIQGEVDFKDLSDEINPSGWSKFVTLGQINKVVDEIKKFWSNISTFLTGYANSITTMLNNSKVWTFPGGMTFAFKNAAFSDHHDLVAEVTYVEPTYARLNNEMTAELYEIEQNALAVAEVGVPPTAVI